MPFERGSFTLSIFELPEELPENAAELLAARKACPLDAVTGEIQTGWCTGASLIDTDIKEETIRRGSFLHFNLRQAVRKIPAALLNALCRREEQFKMRAEQLSYIGRKMKKQIKEEIVEKYLSKMPPALSGTPVVVDPARKLLYLGASGGRAADLFIDQFYQTFKVEPLQFTPASILANDYQIVAADFPGLDLTGEVNAAAEAVIGRDFLMYLWYYSERCDKLVCDAGELDVMLEGPLVFAGTGDERGAGETSVRRGENPLHSAEAKAALSIGKKLRKAKLTFTRGDQIWSGVFDADAFSFGSFTVPEGEMIGDLEAFVERMETLSDFKDVVTAFFRTYVEAMDEKNRAKTIEDVTEWIRSRDAI